MSFLDGLKAVGKWISGSSTGATLLKVVAIGAVVNKIGKSIAKDSEEANGPDAVDPGVRLQVAPNTNTKIPILYGSAYFGGNITEAVMSNSNKTMHYCITLCEKTGVKLSDGQASAFTFKDIYWNDQRMVFGADGITAQYTVDRNGVLDRSVKDLIKVWCYKGSSSTPATIENYTTPNTTPAYTVVPGWGSTTHLMSNLVFAIVEVNYNKDKNVTGLANMLFHMDNSMKLPGDCLYDYMTNERYGAGIPAAEILSQ